MRRLVVVLVFLISALPTESSLAQNGQDPYLFRSDEDTGDRILEGAIQSHTIEGTIEDSSHDPVPDIQVMLLGNDNIVTTYTDQNGYFQFADVAGGHYYTVAPNKYEYTNILDNSQVNGEDIVTVANGELGNTDGPEPGRYHGHGGGWCSEFVSWVYWQAGEPFTGGESDGGACTQDWNMSTTYRVVAGFGRNENWQFISIDEIEENWQWVGDNPLEPQPGDYVFFSNSSGIDRAHSGLVEEIQGTNMHTIEGNISNQVDALIRYNWRTYQSGNTVVKGIGYRRIVSSITFVPRFDYFFLDSNRIADFIQMRYDKDGDNYIDVAFGGGDCDDTDPDVNPGMQGQDCLETPDGVDNDCDGQVDEDKCQGCFIGTTL